MFWELGADLQVADWSEYQINVKLYLYFLRLCFSKDCERHHHRVIYCFSKKTFKQQLPEVMG